MFITRIYERGNIFSSYILYILFFNISENIYVLTRMLRFIAVRIVIERSSSFRLCTGERRYLDARHHYQYPQHTDS